MPAPPLSNTFEGGTDGVTITAGNSGGASGSAFDAPTIGLNCDIRFNTDPLSGGMAGHVVMPATAAQTYLVWASLGALTVPVYLRVYLLKTATPPANWFYPFWFHGAASARCMGVAITTANLLRIDNAAGTSVGTSTLTVPNNQWVRIEVKVVASTTVGSVEYRLYLNRDAPAANYDETKVFTGLVLTATVDELQAGNRSTPTNMNGQHWYYDNIAVSTVDWLGPAQSSTRFVPARMPLGV